MTSWTPEQDKILRQQYPQFGASLRIPGKTGPEVTMRAQLLGLKYRREVNKAFNPTLEPRNHGTGGLSNPGRVNEYGGMGKGRMRK